MSVSVKSVFEKMLSALNSSEYGLGVYQQKGHKDVVNVKIKIHYTRHSLTGPSATDSVEVSS